MAARYSRTNVAINELVAKKPSRPLGTENSCAVAPYSVRIRANGEPRLVLMAETESYPSDGRS